MDLEEGDVVVATFGHNKLTGKPFQQLFEFGYYNTKNGCVVYTKGERNMQDSYVFDKEQIKPATSINLRKINWG